mgnify:FL=1|tara:strand:- start:1036 stop:1290 length:255 start_codon:yes stop_codon:yes gene_type:complete
MIKVKSEKSWDGYYFQVTLDGKKYPRERGAWYIIPRGFEPKQAKEEAVEFAKWERAGKYISSGGVKYNSKADFEHHIKLELEAI